MAIMVVFVGFFGAVLFNINAGWGDKTAAIIRNWFMSVSIFGSILFCLSVEYTWWSIIFGVIFSLVVFLLTCLFYEEKEEDDEKQLPTKHENKTLTERNAIDITIDRKNEIMHIRKIEERYNKEK